MQLWSPFSIAIDAPGWLTLNGGENHANLRVRTNTGLGGMSVLL